MPSSGVRMDDDTVRIAVGLRLGPPFVDPTRAATVVWKLKILVPTTLAAGRVMHTTTTMLQLTACYTEPYLQSKSHLTLNLWPSPVRWEEA